jgi:aspartate/methionine/tyrosine aminotransferase
MAQFVKLQSISLCANVPGQFATYAMVAPPRPGDESFETYLAEKTGILNSLKSKARMLGDGINAIEGLSADSPQGAMYSFVRMTLPASGAEVLTGGKRLEYLTKLEFDYCMALLEQTGICIVPGAGFGQIPGTIHFRTTFLPPEEEMGELVKKLRAFHEEFVRKEQALIG